jgi:hypothetical protein
MMEYIKQPIFWVSVVVVAVIVNYVWTQFLGGKGKLA